MNIIISHEDYYDTETGYIPEELFIWVPPKPKKITGFDTPLDQVILDGEGTSLVFFVPRDWVNSNNKSEWKTRLKDIGWILKEDTSGLLTQFIRLAESPSTSFLDFAKRWGPLWRQASHFGGTIPESFDKAPWIESVEEWRLRAKEVKTILELASYILKEEIAPHELWQKLWPTEYKNIHTMDDQRKWLMHYINFEMLSYKIKFYINWENSTPELKIGSTLGFLSAVWFQLLQSITNKTICLCDGCRRVYARTGRKPARGKKNYCEYCGTAAAKRDYARKRKQGKCMPDNDI